MARNLERWVDGIVIRTFSQKLLEEFAQAAPKLQVINALSDEQHPCQALADVYTIREHVGDLRGAIVTFVGDGNNVARSLAKAAIKLGYPITLVGPSNFQLEPMEGLTQTTDLAEGLAGARMVYTDVWVSMGDEESADSRRLAAAGGFHQHGFGADHFWASTDLRPTMAHIGQ